MKKYLKAEYVTNARLGAIQARLSEYAASDKWGSNRSCFGCLLCLLGFFVVGPIAPIVGMIIYFYYNRYDTEDRRYQVPTQLLQALSAQLDSQQDMLLKIDFRDSLSEPFITAKSDLPPKRRAYSHNWLELQMHTPRGQRLCVKITRVGQEVVRGSGKNESKHHTYEEVVAMSLENFRAATGPVTRLRMPSSAKFADLIGGTTGAAVAIQATGQQQTGTSGASAFDGNDLAGLFEFALKQ